MENESEYSTKIIIDRPTWKGNRKEWPMFKTKFLSYVARNACGDLLTWKQDIPKDSDTINPRDPKDQAQVNACNVKIRIRALNRVVYGMLLNSIKTGTKHGRYVFGLIEKHMNEDYPGGNFKTAWVALLKYTEYKDDVEMVDYEKEYFDKKMKDDEFPPTFIMDLDKKRTLMNKNIDAGRKVDDKTFLKHILGKLPEGEAKEIGPYQHQREIIKDRMKANPQYDVADLTLDLMRVYNLMHPKSDDEDLSESESSNDGNNKVREGKGETGLAAYHKQPKRRCNHCGKWHGGKCNANLNNKNKTEDNSSDDEDVKVTRCGFCKGLGHKKSECFQKNGKFRDGKYTKFHKNNKYHDRYNKNNKHRNNYYHTENNKFHDNDHGAVAFAAYSGMGGSTASFSFADDSEDAADVDNRILVDRITKDHFVDADLVEDKDETANENDYIEDKHNYKK